MDEPTMERTNKQTWETHSGEAIWILVYNRFNAVKNAHNIHSKLQLYQTVLMNDQHCWIELHSTD